MSLLASHPWLTLARPHAPRPSFPGGQERDASTQKKCYKVLAYLCEQRPDFLHAHFAEVVSGLAEAQPAALSASKRNRMRCLKAAVLALAAPDGPAPAIGSGSSREEATKQVGAPLPAGPQLSLHLVWAGADDSGSRAPPLYHPCCPQMVASMVSEVILCVKERNKATRAAAFELLVQIAHAMHEAQPPPPPGAEAMMDGEHWAACTVHPPCALWLGRSQPGCALPMRASPSFSLGAEGDGAAFGARGGLHELFAMVLGGLVGATPHMVSAAVMALARLLYEFAPVLVGLVPDLLPAVLLLMRSKAREVIKSVLGFVKVLGRA